MDFKIVLNIPIARKKNTEEYFYSTFIDLGKTWHYYSGIYVGHHKT